MLKGVNVAGTKVCSHKTSRADYSAQVFEFFLFLFVKPPRRTNLRWSKCCFGQMFSTKNVT